MNTENIASTHEPMSRLEIIGQLRALLIDLMPDAETLWSAHAPERPSVDATGRVRRQVDMQNPLSFRGHLAADSSAAYPLLRERFASFGYTPLLRQQGGYDVVIALPHIFDSPAQQRMKPMRWVPNLILFLVTVATTTLMGAFVEQSSLLEQNPLLLFQQPWLILSGLPSSLTILSILGVHELAHYFVARKHGLETTLPYFIPGPNILGTFGAIIRIRSPWEDRRALFDVGLAGPLAGLIVALPLFFVGLLLSPARLPNPGDTPMVSPLLLKWIEDIVRLMRGIPVGHEIYVNAMTFAAWFGIVITGVNLLPVGQFDGGHVAYAVLGGWARVVGTVVVIALVALGAMVWNGWFVWVAFIFFFGWQHPAPLNAVAPLGRKRAILGLAVFALTLLLFSPVPFPF